MHTLVEQFLHEPSETRSRLHKLSVNRGCDKIRYIAPNGIEFIIDCSDIGSCSEPHVFSSAAERYGSSHEAHTLPGARVDLPGSGRHGLRLSQLLARCDMWAAGLRAYERRGSFPAPSSP